MYKQLGEKAMDEKTMYELLEIYDAVMELEEVEEMLTGTTISTGYEEGIMGKLSYVFQIIARYSPLFTPDVDFEITDFGRVLEDDDLDNHEKARILLGIANL